MGISETKQKILDAALELFNKNGISNVRLQQIADETGISVGNLAYHYSNKEAIAESLISQVIDSLENILRNYGRYASFDDLDFFFKEFYQVSGKYNFFSFDFLEIKRSYPVLHDSLQQLFSKVRLQAERRLDLYQKQRLLQNDVNMKSVVANLWLLLFFIPAEGHLMSKKAVSECLYRRRLWDFLKAYFTAKGNTEFDATIEPELANR